MKTHKVLFLALLVSALLAVSVEAGDRRGNNGRSQAAPARGRSSVQSFSSGSGFRYGGGRTIGSSPHFSSMGVRSMPSQRFAQRSGYRSGGNVGSFSQRQFTPGTFNRSNGFARFQNNGNFGTTQNNRVNRFSSLGNSNGNFNRTGGSRFGNNNRGFNGAGAGNHVFSRRSADWHRDWDRRSDHWWNGHRCRFVNGSWFIFDFGFAPWYGWSYYDAYPYDYYPYGYGGYGYGTYGYDPGVYDQSNYYDQGGYNYNGQPNYYDQGRNNYNDQSNYYDQGRNRSPSYDQSTAVTVADVQDQMTRAGYYHGKIDGVLGPEMRHALLRYQSDKGLGVTGSLTMETRRSLGLAQGGDEVER
jgi:Putative peptidoglycan binding domain